MPYIEIRDGDTDAITISCGVVKPFGRGKIESEASRVPYWKARSAQIAHMAWCAPCFLRCAPDGSQSGEADEVVEGGFAPGATPWNLKDRLAASESNRIGLVLLWSCLAPLSCWSGLPSQFETNVVTLSGVAHSLVGAFGARAVSFPGATDMAEGADDVRS